MLLLDSDILIDIQREHLPALAWFESLADLPCVPGFVVMELINAAKHRQQVQAATLLVGPMRIVWINETDCERALNDFARYHLSHGLGLLDALIAACAIAHAATLCTFNVKHFSIVPGLTIDQPYLR
ncbi:MAG: PIN domain-containing protein [Planctomycetales bacterium]